MIIDELYDVWSPKILNQIISSSIHLPVIQSVVNSKDAIKPIAFSPTVNVKPYKQESNEQLTTRYNSVSYAFFLPHRIQNAVCEVPGLIRTSHRLSQTIEKNIGLSLRKRRTKLLLSIFCFGYSISKRAFPRLEELQSECCESCDGKWSVSVRKNILAFESCSELT